MPDKSPLVLQLNAIQGELFGLVRPLGFRRKGRVFNRPTEIGVVQVISIQTGQFEIGPPLPEPIAHFRPNLYGKFTINLGVFVQEIHNRDHPGTSKKFIQEYSCSIRTRLSEISEGKDHWWSADNPIAELFDEIGSAVLNVGLPWLNRFGTRDQIARDWIEYDENEKRLSNVARLDVAMILLASGNVVGARQLFQEQAERPSHNVYHGKYVREVALKLGLGSLD